MKKTITAALLLLSICFTLTACGDNAPSSDDTQIAVDSGMVMLSKSSSDLKYDNYEDVVSFLSESGFTTISTEALYDIYFGWTDEGETESVKIGDTVDFDRGATFEKTAPVVVTYHMSNEKDPKDRTYNGTVYDYAFYYTAHDGLRANFKKYYLFSEADHSVLCISHNSAGGGRTKTRRGVYSGSFEDSITVRFDDAERDMIFTKNSSEKGSHWECGDDKFSEKDIKSVLYDIRYW